MHKNNITSVQKNKNFITLNDNNTLTNFQIKNMLKMVLKDKGDNKNN
jgi:hypothetical protein